MNSHFWAAAGALALMIGQAPPAAEAPKRQEEAPQQGTDASKAPDGIVWGKGREVQAGLSMYSRYGRPDQRTGLYVFGVYVRNRTSQTVTVRCPSFGGLSVPGDDTDYTTLRQSEAMYATPHIRDSRGRSVPVAVKTGTESRSFVLAPGQIAQVSHWMLRTMDRGKAVSKYTQVAYVPPGKLRVACDVTATWSEKPVTLRTGEVTIDVTAEDLAR